MSTVNVPYRGAGKIVDVTLGSNVDYHGTVAIGDYLIGVARAEGKSGDTVACDIEGVFRLNKSSGALAVGAPVTITAATGVAAATSAGATSNGVVVKAAASDDTTVDVKINVLIPVPAAQSGS